MPKRYLVTNTEITDLPQEFINSKNKRYIHFMHSRLILNNALIGDITIHGDFITDLPYLNNFISFVNVDISKRKKWEILHNPRQIKLWFQDLQGNIIDLTANNGQFVTELMLEF